MRLCVIAILFELLLSCNAKNSASATVEEDLKKAMQAYLYNAVNNDSSNIKYRVENVTYTENKESYSCDFKVNMKAKLFDTTGIMKADISKDFKEVNRLQ